MKDQRGSLTFDRRRVISPGKSRVRTTFQFAANVTDPATNGGPTEVFSESRRLVLGWLQEKFPEALPENATTGESFDLDHHGQALQCVSLLDQDMWSVRLVQPDAPFADRAAVPGRTWTTEISLTRPSDGVRLGVRVLAASLEYAEEPIVLTRPRVVVDIGTRFVLCEAAPLRLLPWRVESINDLKELFDLLEAPERGLPIVLLTQPDERRLGKKTREFLLDHDRLAKRTMGLAYVVTMPRTLNFDWTDAVDRPWSAFQGAVRTYNPSLDFDADALSDHPLAFADRILAFQYRGETGERAFENFLVDRAHEHSANRRMDWDGSVFYADARRLRAEVAKSTATEEPEWRELYEDEISALKQKVDEAELDALAAYDRAGEADQDRDRLVEENRRLQAQIDGLRQALRAKTGQDADASIPIPSTYDGLEEWVGKHLTGRLLLHSRALRGLKNPEFEDVELVYRALLLLAGEYRNMRLGEKDGKERFDTSRDRLHLRLSGSISAERAGEQGDTYFVRYPYASSMKTFLNLHLRSGGNSRDPKRCLAIYLFWDDERQQVVVGWLPSHLENRMT